MQGNSVFRKKLIVLVGPIAFQQFMLALVGASDAVMLGMLEQNAMAAVSLATQVSFVHTLFMYAFNTGCSVFAAQYYGEGNMPAIERVFAYVMKYSLLISVIFSLLSFFIPVQIMRFLTNDAQLVTYGAEYLRAVSLSFILTGISQIYMSIMKNTSHAGAGSAISSAAVVINIILNAILIFGLLGRPALGIRGAAYATVLAKVIEVILVVVYSSRDDAVSLRPRYLLRRETAFAGTFWKYTLPVLGNELVWGCGFAMYSVIMGHMGADAVAANSLANIIKNLVVCLCLGIAAGGGIIVGNDLGADELAKAKTDGKKLLRLSVISGIASGIVLLALIPAILHFANLTDEAAGYLKWMLVISSYYIVGKSINSMTVGGIFPAGGDSRFGLCCDAVTLWCVTVPVGAAAAFIFHAPVMLVYFLLNLDEIIKLPVVFRQFYKYRWVRNLTGEGNL